MTESAERPGWRFSFDDEIRYGDLDAQRHLNNVAFMVFFESARIAFIRDLFPEHDPGNPDPGKHEGGIEDFGLIFAEAHINYRSPGFYGDTIRTWIRAGEAKRSSFRVEFEMCRAADGHLLAEGWGALVGFDYEAGHALPLPQILRDRLAEVTANGVG